MSEVPQTSSVASVPSAVPAAGPSVAGFAFLKISVSPSTRQV